MERTSVCILPGKPEIAFKEMREIWTSKCGSWKVEAKVEGLESVPKFKVRTVRILRRNSKTGEFYDADLNPKLNIPSPVKRIYGDFRKLVREF
ncbi:hypothetical protein [Sporosarcina sp. SAFN-010]|uniref:hypothetical protein n=1 Tax=Sporosarcina sp. SAFN-010 TaxID=3387273 RepID=UPI003F819C0B